jgi:hypothetical protein
VASPKEVAYKPTRSPLTPFTIDLAPFLELYHDRSRAPNRAFAVQNGAILRGTDGVTHLGDEGVGNAGEEQ